MECSFVVLKKELNSALAQFRKIEKSVKKKQTLLEVTVIDGGLILNIPGGELIVQAQTKGTAKFAVRLWYFADIVSTYDAESFTCILTEDTLKVNNTFVSVRSTFFKDDSILRSIDLPANYTHVDLYRLNLSGKYTKEEIEFNKLKGKIEYAMLKVKLDTDDVSLILSKYGFSKKEITEIIMNKLIEGVPNRE